MELKPNLNDIVSSEELYLLLVCIFYMQIFFLSFCHYLLILNFNLVVSSIPNRHFWRFMSKHTKRQVNELCVFLPFLSTQFAFYFL